MSKKRRRELLTVDSQLVEIYEDLTNESEEVRLKAAKKLLLASPTAERRTEVLRRLIRGLCSDRKVARIGFSVALTELLSQLSISPESVSSDSLPVSDPVNVLVTETSIKGGASSQVSISRVSILSTVLRSVLARKKGPTSLDAFLEPRLLSNQVSYSSPGLVRMHGTGYWTLYLN